jgi:DNA-binding Xre family transcriptional regulator
MKIESKVRQLRFKYQAEVGRKVSVQEVADAIKVSRERLTQIELGGMKEIDTDTLAKLCAFYKVGVGDVLEYNPDGIRTPGHAARDLIPA